MVISQADRMKDAPLSRIREIGNQCAELEKQGKKIIYFTVGEPDFDTPKHIIDGAKKALDQGKTRYAPINGIEPLRKAISEKLQKENNLYYEPNEIMVTTGVAQGIFLSLMSFLNEGDEVILPNPGYNSYLTVPNVAGAKILKYSLKEENEFQIDIDELAGLISDKTKILVLITPNNPIGSVLRNETLEKVANLVKDKKMLVVSDEIYERLTYDGEKPISIATLPGMREKTIILNGFSKYFAMTGWRIGYIAAPIEYIDPMVRLSFLMTAGAGTFTQYAAIEALNCSNEESEAMRFEYKRRRDYLVTELNKIDKLSCLKPEGAFYIFLNIKKTGLTSDEFAKYLLEKASVATVPGCVFGDQGEGFVRLSYASSFENIIEAVKRIKIVVDSL